MQLRDYSTSELVFEGTPYAVAKLYVGNEDKYLLDDVPPGFDAAAEISRYEELEALRDDLKKSRVKGVAEQREAVDNTLEGLNPSTPDEE